MYIISSENHSVLAFVRHKRKLLSIGINFALNYLHPHIAPVYVSCLLLKSTMKSPKGVAMNIFSIYYFIQSGPRLMASISYRYFR